MQERDGPAAELLAILPTRLAEQPEGELRLSALRDDTDDITISRVEGFER
jgi:hypothetical protein